MCLTASAPAEVEPDMVSCLHWQIQSTLDIPLIKVATKRSLVVSCLHWQIQSTLDIPLIKVATKISLVVSCLHWQIQSTLDIPLIKVATKISLVVSNVAGAPSLQEPEIYTRRAPQRKCTLEEGKAEHRNKRRSKNQQTGTSNYKGKQELGTSGDMEIQQELEFEQDIAADTEIWDAAAAAIPVADTTSWDAIPAATLMGLSNFITLLLLLFYTSDKGQAVNVVSAVVATWLFIGLVYTIFKEILLA